MAGGCRWCLAICRRIVFDGLLCQRNRRIYWPDPRRAWAWQCRHFNCYWRGGAGSTARKTLACHGACHQFRIIRPVRAGADHADFDGEWWLAICAGDAIGDYGVDGGGGDWLAHPGWQCPPGRRPSADDWRDLASGGE